MSKPRNISKKGVYKQLTEPYYLLTKGESPEIVLKNIECLCTQLRLDQRSITILGVNKHIQKSSIYNVISESDNRLSEDGDTSRIKIKFVHLKEYNVVIIYMEDLYFDLLEEICSKKEHFTPYLFHYLFTKLFGYSDRVLKLFLKKWIDN